MFLALWPDAAIVDALTSELRRWRFPPAAAVVAVEQLHVTLHFIGAIARSRLPAVAEALRVVFEPFELPFGRSAMWRGGIAVFEPSQVPAPLLALHARLADALSVLTLPVEQRRYRPHVTMARRATGAMPPGDAAMSTWLVTGYALVESRGGRYATIRGYR